VTTRRALSTLIEPGFPFEVRALDCQNGRVKPFVISGYFDNVEDAIAAVDQLDKFQPAGIYVTLNPCKRDLIARSPNKLTHYPKHTTADKEVERLQKFLIDLDPVRATGVSSTDREKAAAEVVADKIADHLSTKHKWPRPIKADSGNGFHLLYRINLPNDSESTTLLQNILKALSAEFSTDEVKVDEATFNPSRIVKLYGTTARKGCHTEERPHRPCQLLSRARKPQIVSVNQLRAVAGSASQSADTKSTDRDGRGQPRLSVESWLTDRTVEFDVRKKENQTKYVLKRCPYHGDHGGKDTVIFQDANGKMGAHCFHTRCAGKGREEFKEKIGPPAPEHYDPPLKPKHIDANELASGFLATLRSEDGTLLLRRWRGQYWCWSGQAWQLIPDEEFRGGLVRHLADQGHRITRDVIGNVLECVRAECMLAGTVEQPSWLSGQGPWPAAETLATASGLLHLPAVAAGRRRRGSLHPLTPDYFSGNVVPYGFDPKAKCPKWENFLRELWPKDGQSINTLQEWFGYCLLGDTRQQKIFGLIGPPRSGKGTIATVLRNVLGERNAAGPTLSSLTSPFGLSPLLGKTLAIISDARLGARSDIAQVVERLLSISGEDAITVDRKYLEPVTVRLRTRFVLLTNELPRFHDTSGALVNRFILLRLVESWLGREDKDLGEKLLAELPGILNWAIEGYRQLRKRGHLVQPRSGKQLVGELGALTSPVGTFVGEWCVTGPNHRVECRELYAGWQQWCIQKGHRYVTNEQTFGRDLRTVLPGLKTSQRRVSGGERKRVYLGVALNDNRRPRRTVRLT